MSATVKPAILQEPPDFSLVLGGPLFQLFRRAGMAGDAVASALPATHGEPTAKMTRHEARAPSV